jgi:hypothetical protein
MSGTAFVDYSLQMDALESRKTRDVVGLIESDSLLLAALKRICLFIE